MGSPLSPVIFRAGPGDSLQSGNVEILPEAGSACMGELSKESERLLESVPSVTLGGTVS